MDLNLIAKYGIADGTISNFKQRSILYICDEIIGGQGDGPLNPEPLPLDFLMLSENPALMDIPLSYLMKFNPDKLPLLREARDLMIKDEAEIIFNNQTLNMSDLAKFSVDTIAPLGWIRYLDNII
ncbi:MAG TPA: hypothetical protein PKJ14_01750 [Candidatus Cloacimonadota bacterium]|nr:hypothetical protein [Candidatus Cloacimonadota bacterium]